MKISYMTFYSYDRHSNICPIFHHLGDKRNQNVHDHDLNLYDGPRINLNIPIESPDTTSYLMTIVLLARYLTIYEIIENQIKFQKVDIENEG